VRLDSAGREIRSRDHLNAAGAAPVFTDGVV
jgi:hypothetical protein